MSALTSDSAVRFLSTNAKPLGTRNLPGLKNGKLLSAAESTGFDVIITVDQNIPYQQNLRDRKISLLILCAPTNRLRDLQQLVPAVRNALIVIQPGQTVKVG
ncbi:MAG TPA: hypothetical protein VLI55_09270 [Bryobacteraceae bacterium]|nr:hypothetical protein [Bryobacteraceae bacterium]